MNKEFYEWFKLKSKLSRIRTKQPFAKEGEFWWISIGRNIGNEINGKSKKYSRPAIIIKKFSKNLYLIAPATTQFKTGNWYSRITINNKVNFICLHQIRTIDYRRLLSKIGQIEKYELKVIKQKLVKHLQ